MEWTITIEEGENPSVETAITVFKEAIMASVKSVTVTKKKNVFDPPV